MQRIIRCLCYGFAAVLAVCAGINLASAQESVANLPVNQTTSYKGEEFLLIGSATRGAGEPVIVIHPKDPNIILVGAMANLHQVEGQKLLVTEKGFDPESLIAYRNTPDSSISTYAISYDRGRTWRYFDDPFREYDRMNTTADVFVGAAPDGTLFIGAMSFFPKNASPLIKKNEVLPSPGHLLYGHSVIASSSDNGKTWSTPVGVMGQSTPLEEYAPGLKPNLRGSTPYDRPFIISDSTTGTVYVNGSGTGGDNNHMETFIRASNDKGKTWGLIYSYDSPDYPQGGFGSRPTAAHGALAVAYGASGAPASAGSGKCPCVVVGVSRDEGKTFDRHVVQFDTYRAKGFDGMGGPAISADPSHPGRFAVMTLGGSNTEMLIQVTDDYGKTWKGPVKAGSVPGTIISRPDIAYSPKGELGVMWLAKSTTDGTYTAWSNASRDGGFTFGKQVQVSQWPSPTRASIKLRGNNWDGDDLSSIAVDSDFVHIVWADNRAGFMGSWYARVPLTSY